MRIPASNFCCAKTPSPTLLPLLQGEEKQEPDSISAKVIQEIASFFQRCSAYKRLQNTLSDVFWCHVCHNLMFFQIISSIINIIWYYSIWYYVSVSCIVLPYWYLTYFLYLFCFFGGVWHNYWPSRPSLVPAAPSPSLSQNDPTGQTWDWRETWFELFQLVSEEAKHSMSCCMWCATQIQPRASGFKKPHLIRCLEIYVFINKCLSIYQYIYLDIVDFSVSGHQKERLAVWLLNHVSNSIPLSGWLCCPVLSMTGESIHTSAHKQSKGTAGMRRIWE
jgi:hypothetical protein